MATDPLDASSLGDLPNAGYSTRGERELSDAIMLFMRGVERDRLWLLSIVCDGLPKFRRVMLKQWAGMPVYDHLIEKVFDYFVRQAGAYPELQRDMLIRDASMNNVQRVWGRG